MTTNFRPKEEFKKNIWYGNLFILFLCSSISLYQTLLGKPWNRNSNNYVKLSQKEARIYESAAIFIDHPFRQQSVSAFGITYTVRKPAWLEDGL